MQMVLLNPHFFPSVSFSEALSYVHFPALLQQFQYHSCALSIIFNNLFRRHLNVPQGIIFPNLTDIFQIEIFTDHWFRHCLPHLLLLFTGWPEGPLREGPVWASPRSRSKKNGVPFVTGPSLRYFSWLSFGHVCLSATQHPATDHAPIY